MVKKDEKTILRQTGLSLNLLGSLVKSLNDQPNQTLKDFFLEWEKEIDWDKPDEHYSIVNQGVLLTHLYGLIVYPHSVFQDEIPETIKVGGIDKNEWGNFVIQRFPKIKKNGKKTIIKNEDELDLKSFIKGLRDPISHARVTISADNSGKSLKFRFDGGREGMEVEFSITGLQKFTKKLSECYLSGKWG